MFTVVIPLFNKKHTIVRTLSTVLSQTFPIFEVIIVNDGSTDNVEEVLNSFTSDGRIKIINQENHGVSSARNTGVEAAKFEYIAFLDGDDEWLPNYLAKMKEAIMMFPSSGMYCCAGYIRNADGSEIKRIANKFDKKILKINFFENPHVFLHTSATIILKSEFLKTGGFPVGLIRNEDFALFYSLALITPVVYCGFPLSIYVGGVAGQATSTLSDKNILMLAHIVKRYNLVFENWQQLSLKNNDFKIFIKYELRHSFICQLRNNDYVSIQFVIDNLNTHMLSLFSKLEVFMFKNEPLKFLAIKYILLTKIRWRMRGFPYIGQK
jgi:glycosyltransferase involved in cell wall biosynthesis